MISTETGCAICGASHETSNCTIVKVKHHICDKKLPTRAYLTLPNEFRVEKMAEGTFSIVANEFIERGTQFGPFQAQRIFTLNPEILFPLKIFTTDDYFSEYFLDISDEENCNWMIFINPAQSVEEQNVMCYQENKCIYYITINDVGPGEFLKVWYSPYYAIRMKKNILNDQNEMKTASDCQTDINQLLKKQQNIMDRENWTCKFCGMQESDVSKFATHISDHYTKQLRKICEICKDTFLTRKGLKKHLRVVHNSTTYCNINKKTVNTTTPISEKVAVKDSLLGGPLLNEILTESLDNSNLLLQQSDLTQFDNPDMLLDADNLNVDNILNVKELEHFNFDIDGDQEEFVCDICLKSFGKLKLLLQHLKRHTGKYMCPHCLMIFCRNENLKAHTCFGTNQPKFKCDICNKKFTLHKYLIRHTKAIHNKKYQCNNCSKLYFSIKETKEHNCSAVPDEQKEKFVCFVCNKSFLRDIYLKKHMKVHEPKKEKTPQRDEYICEVCAKSFSAIKNLNKHSKTHMEPTFACDVCNKKFYRKDVLLNHMAIHGNCEVSCKVCGKISKTPRYLKLHMLQHGKKKYKCLDCEMQFFQRSNLNKHVQRAHSKFPDGKAGPTFYICPVCKKVLKFRTSLARHMKNCHPESNAAHVITEEPEKSAETCNDTNKPDGLGNMNFNEDLSEFSISLIDSLNDGNVLDVVLSGNGRVAETGGLCNDVNISLEPSYFEDDAITPAGICLSMPDISEAEEQITLGENAYIMENGTIVQPLDQGNVVLYILDKKIT